MSVAYYGDFAEDDTVNIPFNTFSSNDPSASVTATDLIASDIYVHKDGSATAITTDGATVDVDAPGVGAHMITIDTSVDAAYATGSEYAVRVDGVTVDGGTINAWIGAFSIERAGGALAITKLIQTAVITNAVGADVSADILTAQNDLDTITGTSGVLIGTDAANVTEISDAVWDEAQTEHVGAGTFGIIASEIADILVDTAEIGAAGVGLSNIGTIATVTNLTNLPTIPANWLTAAGTAADFGTEIATAVGTQQMTESYAANGAAPTRDQAAFAIHQMLMQFGIVTTSVTVRKLDNTTTAFIVTLDDATSPTDAKRV